MKKPIFPRRIVTTLLGGLLVGGAAMTQGCLERPVVEQTPNTSNIFVENILNTAIDKIDLLFVIDNSVSMADKQQILELAVPQMVARLVTPDCVDNRAEPTVRQPNPGTGDCPEGLQTEFDAVNDIHIGVITSSLGGHGASTCEVPESNDRALLIPNVRDDVSAPNFLAWNGPEESNLDALQEQVAAHVVAAGENGCGFEAPLEAWYRFLVDPSPPAGFEFADRGRVQSIGVSQEILDQRDAFLRPDSLVAIVVLTDENDCSAMEGGSYYNNAGFGWLVAEVADKQKFGGFPVSSPVCDENPNDRCCFSCLGGAPEGCDGSLCNPDGNPDTNDAPLLSPEKDRPNARCFDNKRRFGIDLLYPVKRYVDGLSSATIVDSQTGEEVPNPLLRSADPAKPPRDPGLVFFAGIVGVPWQDIATEESLGDASSLRYLNAKELATPSLEVNGEQVDRWAVILGQPFLPADSKQCQGENAPAECGRAPNPPLDPFMIESIDPREGVNPITGDATISFTGTGSTINGHEYDNSIPNAQDSLPAQNDLQYSCIFPLEPIDAVKEDCTPDTDACDCGTDLGKESPLCKPDADAGTAATNTQYWGKAYPATRVLQVLRDFGANSIVASICPKILEGGNPDFGYNPAVSAIIDRLKEKLGGQCLPRELTLDEGEVPCTVVEALRRPGDGSAGLSDCVALGREAAGEEVTPAVRQQLLEGGFCSDEQTCQQYDLCEIPAAEGEALANCFDPAIPAEDPRQIPGFCYIDPAKGPEAGGTGSPCTAEDTSGCTNELVDGCPASQRRLLRFVGERAGQPVPYPNAVTFVACVGEAAGADGDVTVVPGEVADPGTGMGGGN